MIAAATTVLGVIAGLWISHTVTDETEWYQTWFFRATAAVFLLIPVTLFLSPGSYALIPSILIGLVLSVIALLGVRAARAEVVALASAALALIVGAGGWQLLLVALIPATGYLYPRIPRTQFAWFLAVPTIIILWSLLM